MTNDKINDFDAKFLLGLLIIGGTLAIFMVLMFNTIPAENRDTVNNLVTAWLTVGFATMIKFLFDGTKSGDLKNATMADQAKAAASTAMVAEAALRGTGDGAPPREVRVVNDAKDPVPVSSSPQPWSEDAVFAKGDEVSHDGVTYVSLQDHNQGNPPATAAAWWQKKDQA